MKKYIKYLFLLLIVFSLVGCTKEENEKNNEIANEFAGKYIEEKFYPIFTSLDLCDAHEYKFKDRKLTYQDLSDDEKNAMVITYMQNFDYVYGHGFSKDRLLEAYKDLFNAEGTPASEYVSAQSGLVYTLDDFYYMSETFPFGCEDLPNYEHKYTGFKIEDDLVTIYVNVYENKYNDKYRETFDEKDRTRKFKEEQAITFKKVDNHYQFVDITKMLLLQD